MAIKRKTNGFFARADRIDQSRRTVAKSDLAFLGWTFGVDIIAPFSATLLSQQRRSASTIANRV
jgi:hypothetical protein